MPIPKEPTALKIHEMRLSEFKNHSSLLPLGDNGEPTAHAGRSAEQWMSDYAQRARELAMIGGHRDRDIDRLVSSGIARTMDHLRRAIGSAVAVPLLMPDIRHCVVAFKASVFCAYTKNPDVLEDRLLREKNRFDFVCHLLMLDAAGDPIRFIHSMSRTQAGEKEFQPLLDSLRPNVR